MSRFVALGVVLLTALLFQAVVAPAFGVGGWRPDLVLLTVVGVALADGAGTGARYGFTAGLAADLLSGGNHLVGLSALVFLLVGDGLGRLRPYMSGTGIAGEIAMGAVGGMAAFGMFGGLSLLLDLGQFTPGLLLQGLIATALWTGLLTPVFVRPMAAISRRYPVADAPAPAASGPISGPRSW